MSKPATVVFKTLMEFCPSEENLELAIRAIARKKKVFTADDLHQLDASLELLGYDRRKYGSLLKSLEKQGFIKSLGYTASSRSTCHNRPVIQWQHVEGT